MDITALHFHEFLSYAARYLVTHHHQSRIKDNKSVLQSILDVCDTQSNRFQRWILLSRCDGFFNFDNLIFPWPK